MSNRILTLVLATTAFANSVQAGLITYEIKADTTGLVPGPGGLIDISLGASTEGAPSVSVQVYDPLTNGTLGGATPLFGTAAGDLKTPGGVTVNNSQLTNELTQDFTISSFFDVFVDIQGSEIGAGAVGPWTGTELSITIYDSSTGSEGASFLVNPNVDANGNPIIDGTIETSSSNGVMIEAVSAVPEPSSIVLLGLGAVVAGGGLRRRGG